MCLVTKTELVNRLVEVGLDVSSAEKIVLSAVEKYKNANPMADDYKAFKFAETVVNIQVNKLRQLKGKLFEGTVIAIDEPRDMYSGLRNKALRMWKEDKQKAIIEGYCKPSENNPDEPIVLDWRKTLRNGQPNPNYGKPLPEIIVTDIYMIVNINGESTLKILSFSGEAPNNLKVGAIYSFTANNQKGLYMQPLPIKPFEEIGVEDPQELFNKTLQVLTSTKFFRELCDLQSEDIRNYSTIATVGTIVDKSDTQRGSTLLLEDIHNPTGGVYAYCRGTLDYDIGTEVIVIGTLVKTTPPKVFTKGIIPNPESTTDVLSDLLSF